MKKTIKFGIITVVLLLIGVLFAPKLWSSFSKKDAAKVGQERIAATEKPVVLKDGDIIFQVSQSDQCKAIQLATKSKYSHCGILFKENGQFYVYEAVQRVSKTPLENWIARGDNQHYVIKRLSNAESVLTNDVISQMKKECQKHLGKNYDMTFEWSDDRIYCSELVWKAYKNVADIEVGQLEQLQDFDLSHPIVQQKVKERYGHKIPLKETVISPAAIFNATNLETILSENNF